MRDRFPLLLLGGLALAGALGTVLLQGGRRGAFAERFSTYRSEPDGARALALLLEAQGLEVRRWQAPLEELPPGAPLLLLGVGSEDAATPDGGAEPSRQSVTAEETLQLLKHVSAGATLVHAPSSARKDLVLEALGVSLVEGEPGLRTLVPALPSRFTLRVERLEAPTAAALELPEGAVPLLVDAADEEVVVAAQVAHGAGRVVVLTAPELLTNRYLAKADNARFASALAREVHLAQPLLVDELHHGFSSGRSLGEFARRYGLDLAAAQLLLGLALWALALRRPGAVRPPARELRVGATDALAALSRIYREGRHHRHAAASLLQGLCADLAPRAGVAAASTPDQVALGLESRGRHAQARALREVATRAPLVHTDGELLALARLASSSRTPRAP